MSSSDIERVIFEAERALSDGYRGQETTSRLSFQEARYLSSFVSVVSFGNLILPTTVDGLDVDNQITSLNRKICQSISESVTESHGKGLVKLQFTEAELDLVRRMFYCDSDVVRLKMKFDGKKLKNILEKFRTESA